MFNKIKAVKNLRDQAKSMQKTLEGIVETGEGAKGEVKIQINGAQKILSIELSDEVMTSKDKVAEGVKDALNDGMKKIQKKMASQMKDMGDLQDMMKQLGM